MSEGLRAAWTEEEIGSNITIQSGFPFSSDDFRGDRQGLPLIRIRDLLPQSPSVFVTPGDILNEFYVSRGDLLVGMDGDFNIVKWKGSEAVLNQRVCKVVGNSQLDTDFLFHLLSAELPKINAQTGSTTVKHLAVKDIASVSAKVPPIKEQQKIAEILTSVDEVIENTQSQIDKLEDLKKATMNELLTKGIGHTEFKETEIGRIPKGWDTVTLGDLSALITSGSRGWSQYYSSSGAMFIRISNLTRKHINLKFEDMQFVSPPPDGEGTRTRVSIGDVLISITADLGVIAVIGEHVPEAYVNQHVSLVRLKCQEKTNPRWVGHFLASGEGQRQFSKLNDGGAKAGLNLKTIGNLLVPMPTTNEQQKIVDVLDRLDDEIKIKTNKCLKQKELKKSLMQDLLTGKVRVKAH